MKAANKDLFSDAISGRSTTSSSWQFPINGEHWHDLDKNAPEESVFISQLHFWTSFHVNADSVDQWFNTRMARDMIIQCSAIKDLNVVKDAYMTVHWEVDGS